MPGFIASQIARINRNYALVALVPGVVAAWIVWFGWMYISAVVLGPRPVTAQELASPGFQADVKHQKRVFSVAGESVSPVFYSSRVRRGKGYGTVYCWFLKAGPRQLVVESWDPSPKLRAAGTLQEVWPPFQDWAHKKFPDADILPIFLDEREWKQQGWTMFGFAAVLATGAAVVAGLLTSWNISPERHPVRRAILRLGDFDAAAMQIDGEMQSGGENFGPVRLGQTTLVYAPAFSFDVLRLQNIASARTEWLRKGKSTALYLLMDTHDARKVKWEISGKYADAMLASVCAAAHIEPNGRAEPKTIELRIGSKS